MLKFGLSVTLSGQDINSILNSIRELELEYIDLRTIGDKNVTDLSNSEVKQIKDAIQEHGVKVSTISPFLFFRLPLTEGEDDQTIRGSYSGHLNMLNRAIELAQMFDCNLIRCFSFETEFLFSKSGYKDLPFDIWGKIIERLQKAVRIAEAGGVTLALENCHWCNLGTGLLAAKAIKEIGSKNVGLWWDPANSAMASGENPYPEEYEQVKDCIVSIDMKDVVIDKRYNYWSHVGMGKGNKVNWPEIFQALTRDNYQGVIHYESAYIPEGGTIDDGAKESFSNVRRMLASQK
jgi:sugar phosphate isomerase/epimerase